MHILLTMAHEIDIRDIRKRLNWSRARLAEEAKVDISTVCRWENGKVPERGAARALLERFARRAALRPDPQPATEQVAP